MKRFVLHRGVAAPLLRTNIDTDAIIPSREMKLVSKQGLGKGLFAGLRYTESDGRIPDPEFVLNKAAYKNTSVLLSGANFGCGSSREHAVWALQEYGIRAIVAPSFGAIFYGNCTRNGILPIVLSELDVHALADQIEADPQHSQLDIDLSAQRLTAPDGNEFYFDIEAGPKEMLLEGLDPIAMTLRSDAAIENFQQRYQRRYPWLCQTN